MNPQLVPTRQKLPHGDPSCAPSLWLRERANPWAMQPPDPVCRGDARISATACALPMQEVF